MNEALIRVGDEKVDSHSRYNMNRLHGESRIIISTKLGYQRGNYFSGTKKEEKNYEKNTALGSN